MHRALLIMKGFSPFANTKSNRELFINCSVSVPEFLVTQLCCVFVLFIACAPSKSFMM